MTAIHKQQCGMTIVELMVSLAIAAVLIGMAAPAFNGFVAQNRLTTQLNDFVLAVQYARSEAGRIGGNTAVQAVNSGDNANEWGPGWCVVTGNPGNCDNALRTFEAIGTNTIDALGGLDGMDALRFDARGLLLTAAGGTLDLCDPDEPVGRTITVSAIGRVSSQEKPDCIP